VLNQAFDVAGLKKGADWEIRAGRIRLGLAGLERIEHLTGHSLKKEAAEGAKAAAADPSWSHETWVRLRVQNPHNIKTNLLLGYRMDTGNGVRCLVPDASRFVIGMHVVVRPTQLASAPDLYELAEPQPRKKGEW
jgi:hypothetical protein